MAVRGWAARRREGEGADRNELSRGDRSLARTWARLDGGREMRNRERVVGYGRWLGMCAPWLDVVGMTVETHIQALANRRAHS